MERTGRERHHPDLDEHLVKVANKLREHGASPEFQQQVTPILRKYCDKIGQAKGVMGIEIGFRPGHAVDAQRLEAYELKDGIVYVVTIVESNRPGSMKDDIMFRYLTQAEWDCLASPVPPIEFHIVNQRLTPTKTGKDIFGRVVKKGIHLDSLPVTHA